jgi:hypothetical protein
MRHVDVVLCHITRMHEERVCLAGVDLHGRHLRPVVRGEPDWCTQDVEPNGPIALGALVQLAGHAGGSAPHTEDVVVRRASLVPQDRLPYAAFFERISTHAGDLEACFGAAHSLARNTNRLVVVPGAGSASLATIRTGPVDAYVRRQRFYLGLEHADLGAVELSLADLRLLPWQSHRERLGAIAECLHSDGGILTIGLSRPWGNDEQWCWAQVNGIFVTEPELTGW